MTDERDLLDRSDMHDYQLLAETHGMLYTHCGLFMDMGLGKTATTLSLIDRLMYEELEIGSVLVVAPKRVAESVWAEETQEWRNLQHLKVSKVAGRPEQRRAALAAKADIYVIGRDNIAWLCGLYGGSSLPFDMLVIDELSSFKNPRSVRFKALRKVQASFQRVIGLTGTPAPNGLIDLWSQIWMLDRGIRLGRTLGEYRRTYFYPAASNGHVVYKYALRKGSADQIHEKIADICISMSEADYLPKREVTHNYIRVPFPDALMDRYKAFEKEAVLELSEGGVIPAYNAGALTNKLLQFANGAVYDENKKSHVVHDLKIDAVEEVVENANGKPVLVAYGFRQDLARLQKRLKRYKPRLLSSDDDIKDWNAGRVNVMLLHPASGGHGLNLQHGGSILVWCGLNWSLELYQQLNKRLDRQGQKDAVHLHHIVAPGTADDNVMRALKTKSATQSDLIAAIQARAANYLENFS